MSTKLYFAYGSNNCHAQMAKRCPAAKPLHRIVVPDWRLVFRRVADIIPSRGDKVFGGLWRITEECERALDKFEGIDTGLYFKHYFLLDNEKVLVYLMDSNYLALPTWKYEQTIRQGYRDFNLPIGPFDAAMKESYAADKERLKRFRAIQQKSAIAF